MKIFKNLWLFLLLLIPIQLLAQGIGLIESTPFYIYFLLGMSGIALHIISKIRNAFANERLTMRSFIYKPNWFGHFLYAIFALLVVTIAIVAKDSITQMYEITYISIALLGYGADSIFKNWSNFN